MIQGRKPILVRNAEGEEIARFDCVSRAAEHYGLSHGTIIYRIRTARIKDGLSFEFVYPDDGKRNTLYKTPCVRTERKDVSFNDGKYKIVPYEVKMGHVCITPCPYMISPKIMVGSVKCQRCGSFKGRDTRAHQVACNRSYYQ